MSLNTWAKGNLGGSLEIGASGSESSGGGGGGDFTTAEVTVQLGDGKYVEVYGAIVVQEEGQERAGTSSSFGANKSGTYKQTVVLYKGSALLSIDTDGTISTSGDIEQIHPPEPFFYAVGDCTITIS